MCKISYIIPIYKVEKYLDQCISSIISQTYNDFEVILVDDGSPDNCPVMCDDWAKKDERISAVHKKNGGQSDARNYGLKYAKGEYVIFLDSDDFWIDNDALSKMNKSIELHPETDVLFFNVFYDYGDGKTQNWPLYKLDDGNTHSSTESIRSLVESGTVPMSAWSKVIKKSLLIDNKIEFQLGIVGEDIPWFINLMMKTENVIFLNDYIYAYRQNNASSITKTNLTKHVKDMKFIIEESCLFIDKSEQSTNMKAYMKSFVAYNYCILLSQINNVKGLEKVETWNFLQKYKFLLQFNCHPKVKKVRRVSNLLGLRLTSLVLILYKKLR